MTRANWLDAAMDMLVSQGAGGVKVFFISGRLGVSRFGIYRYFKGRKDLFSALLEECGKTSTALVALMPSAQSGR